MHSRHPRKTLRSVKLLVSALLLLCSLQGSAQEPHIRWGAEIDPVDDIGSMVAQNDAFGYFFHKQKVKETRRGTESIGTINILDLDDLRIVSRFPLNVPLQNADKFQVEAFVPLSEGLRFVYTYYSKADAVKRLAIVDFSLAGEILGTIDPLLFSEGSREKETLDVQVVVHKTTGMIAVLQGSRLRPDLHSSVFDRDVEIVVLDRELNVLHKRVWQLGPARSYNIDTWTCDRSGNLYFSMDPASGTGINSRQQLLTTIDIQRSTIQHVERPEDMDKWHNPYGSADFFETSDGRMIHYRAYVNVKRTDIRLGYTLTTFGTEDARHRSTRLSPFGISYPPDEKEKKEPGFANLSMDRRSLTSDGTILTMGYLLEYKGENKIRPGIISYEFDPEKGFLGLMECKERSEIRRSEWRMLDLQFLHQQDFEVILMHEDPNNLNKECGSLTSWDAANLLQESLVDCYVILQDRQFGPRLPLLPEPMRVEGLHIEGRLEDGRTLLSIKQGPMYRIAELTWR